MTDHWPDRLRSALATRQRERIPEADCQTRAAVTLILRPARNAHGEPEALFVRRAEVPGDPWSGHIALPGGRMDPEDGNLLDTALRETREETGLLLDRGDHLGVLHELHPRSRHLPSICVTPYVAWLAEPQAVRVNEELTGHVWIPLSALADPEFRSTLVRQRPSRSEFPAIDFEGHVIWGLTFAIVQDFLQLVAESGSP